jgi:class 3 adenylate cyclase
VPALPTGCVTFLFTDIVGSTALWERYPGEMPQALTRHNEIVRAAVEAHRGVVFRTGGDAFYTAFAEAPDGVAAALAAQRALLAAAWGAVGALRVRMALHTGQVELVDSDYIGRPLNRVARLLAVTYGGQVLLSQKTAHLVVGALPPGASLRDLGEHCLRDLAQAERIFQLVASGLPTQFPPLPTLAPPPHTALPAGWHQAKLPGMPSPDYEALFERERERQRRARRLRPDDTGDLFS